MSFDPSGNPQGMNRPVDLIRFAISQFEAAKIHYGHGTTCALDEAAALVLGALHLPPDLPDLYLQGRLTDAEIKRVIGLIDKRTNERVPLPYLLGWCWYAGEKFAVSTDVLVPRSPIFELIEQQFSPWLQRTPDRMLDLCTGSGCLAILMAHAFPGVPVDAADLSPAALAIAQQNVTEHALKDQVELLEGDGLLACGERRYDLIVSNPPYVPSEEYADLPAEYGHEPRMALEAGSDGLDFVRQMLRMAPASLSEAGVLICEVGSAAHSVMEEFGDWPLTWLDFETGGDGVFVISREELVAALQGGK